MTTELIAKLKNEVKGQVVLPDDSNYDEVRTIWNAMIDRRPAVIVQCAEAADSSRALQFARDNGLEIAIRGAGHNIAGNAVCEGGMLIDHSKLKNVRVDKDRKRAYVEPGATLGDFDAAVQAHGLATPVGINSTTGIAGQPDCRLSAPSHLTQPRSEQSELAARNLIAPGSQ
jgi:FAD/FMN-containing dehydrogenase